MKTYDFHTRSVKESDCNHCNFTNSHNIIGHENSRPAEVPADTRADQAPEAAAPPCSEPSLSPEEQLQLQAHYERAVNELMESERFFKLNIYFVNRWMPVLGPALTLIIIALRKRCYINKKTGEVRNVCWPSIETIANDTGLSIRTVERYLNPEDPQQRELLELFVRKEARYIHDPKSGTKRRTSNLYHVNLNEPIHPDDRPLVEQMVAQYLAEEAARPRPPAPPAVEEPQPSATKTPLPENLNDSKEVSPDCQIGIQPSSARMTEELGLLTRSNTPTAAEQPHQEAPRPTSPPVPAAVENLEEQENTPSPKKAPSSTDTSTGPIGGPAKVRDPLVKEVRRRFGNRISIKTIEALIAETSRENVANQLKWFSSRDNSWAKKGPAAAFMTYCRQQREEPEAVKARRREAEQTRARAAEDQSRTAYEAFAAATFHQLLAAMTEAEIDQLEAEVKAEGGPFCQSKDSPAFVGLLRQKVFRRNGVPTTAEEWRRHVA